jgi:hypothetical protein
MMKHQAWSDIGQLGRYLTSETQNRHQVSANKLLGKGYCTIRPGNLKVK